MTLQAAVLSSSTLSDVEPGLLGFLIVAALGVALVFLLRSMNKQFRKLGPPPDESGDAEQDDGEADNSGAGDATGKGAKRR